MDDTILWLIGGGAAAVGSLLGRIELVRKGASDSLSRVHDRLDEFPKEFVRRDEIMDHIGKLETSMNGIRRDTNERLDKLFTLLVQEKKGS